MVSVKSKRKVWLRENKIHMPYSNLVEIICMPTSMQDKYVEFRSSGLKHSDALKQSWKKKDTNISDKEVTKVND